MAHLEKLPNVILLTLDVTSASSIAAAVESVKAKTGGTLDYLVNNSGIAHVMPLLDTDIAVAKSMFDVNLWAVIAMTQAFAPMVIRAKGVFVNVGSISGFLNAPYMSKYLSRLTYHDFACTFFQKQTHTQLTCRNPRLL